MYSFLEPGWTQTFLLETKQTLLCVWSFEEIYINVVVFWVGRWGQMKEMYVTRWTGRLLP
jgi:hypothetical protein